MLLRRVEVWKDSFGGFEVELNIIYYTIEYAGWEGKRTKGSWVHLSFCDIYAALMLFTLPANVMLIFACIIGV